MMGALGLIQETGASSVAVWFLRVFGLILAAALIGLVASIISSIKRSLLWKRISK